MTRLSAAQLSQEHKDCSAASISSLQLSHRALTDISCLVDFTNLERLDLSSNNLSSLEGLSSCINLKWLSVLENKLQRLKGIEGLAKLTVLNAGKNKLISMEEVRSLISLRALILNDNNIASVTGLEELKHLNTIVLSRNPIDNIGASLTKVKSVTKLSLSNCQVRDIGSSLMFCMDLKEVRLSHNEITGIPAELARNINIQILDLGHNLIGKWSDMKVLSSLHNLKNLNLQGNPISENDKLTKKIKKLVPSVQIYNTKPIEGGDNYEKFSKKAVPNHFEHDDFPNNATDVEAVKEPKRKKPIISSKGNVSGYQKAAQSPSDATQFYDAEKNVKNKKLKKSMLGSENISNSSKDVLELESEGKRREPHNVDSAGKLVGLDDAETPFELLVLSENTRNHQTSVKEKRDHQSFQDAKSLSRPVSLHSMKNKTSRSTGMSPSTLKLLSPTSEVGVGGPSTWDT